MAHNTLSLDLHNNTYYSQQQTEQTTLIVKHIPSTLYQSREDLEGFFKSYGAVKVRPMESKKMKGIAFLDFNDHLSAIKAIEILKGYKFDTTHKGLRIEFAKNHPSKLNEETPHPNTQVTTKIKSNQTSQQISVPIAEKLGINYPPNPQLKYKYPDPTPEIISNMMNSIATVPRLYNQVLHLMNKMNLPPPFGPQESSSAPSILKRKHDDLLASDESEIESEENDDIEQKAKLRRMTSEKQKQILRNKK